MNRLMADNSSHLFPTVFHDIVIISRVDLKKNKVRNYKIMLTSDQVRAAKSSSKKLGRFVELEIEREKRIILNSNLNSSKTDKVRVH